MQTYGRFEELLLSESECIVWVGNIMTPVNSHLSFMNYIDGLYTCAMSIC